MPEKFPLSMITVSRITLAMAALLIAISAYVHFTIGFWGDQDWELLVARMLLDGKKLYVDHVPVNPPLIFFLYMLPAWIALHVTFVEDYQALVLLGLGCAGAAIMLSLKLIAVHPAFLDSPQRRAQFILLLCFLFVFRIASPYFADREYLFIVLTFPYVLRWAPSLAAKSFSPRFRIFVGLFAGIGLFIKPQCLLLFAGVQLICFLRKDRPSILLSIENRLIYGFGVLYLLFIAVVTPEYFTLVVPMALLTYSAISAGSGSLFDFTLIITFALTFVMFRPRRTSPYRRDIYYFSGVAVFLFAYGLLNHGWGYTYQPILTMLLFINALVLWEFLYLKKEYALLRHATWQYTLGASGCWLNFISKAAIVLLYFTAVFHHDCRGNVQCPGYYAPFIREMEKADGPRGFGTIGMNFALWSRVAKLSGAQWDTRFPQMWMIPKFLATDLSFTTSHEWILYYVAGALTEDLEKNKPELMFVDRSDTMYTIRFRQNFDWIGALSAFVNFKAAWGHYAFVRTLDACRGLEPAQEVGQAMMGRTPAMSTSGCQFDLYRRRD